MPPSRRTFLQQASAFGLAWTTTRGAAGQQMPMSAARKPGSPADQQQLPPMLHSLQLPPFVDALPIPQVARPGHGGQLRIGMRETWAKVHRDVPATRMWCYTDLNHGAANGLAPLGRTSIGMAPLIEARSGHPLQVEWVNQLPAHHFLPVDFSLQGCGHDVPEVRACVHLHGGRTPSRDDGYPEDWYVPGQSRLCRYPLQQDAATLWYHDHAMGINRLNIYAGLFGMAIVRDAEEARLDLPNGQYEVPLTLYDRNYSTDGQLDYPVSGDPDHPWVPEFDGDATLINGKIRPHLEVEPRLYRFRVLNTANSRFFALSLGQQQSFHQIGSDQGLLAAPLLLTHLNLAPAERADLLIDFSGRSGERLHLLNGDLGILEFRVAKAQSGPASRAGRPSSASSLPSTLRSIERTPEASATITRTLTLNEALDRTGNSMLMVIDLKRWHEPVTEKPRLNSTEIWEFVNLTEDTHPMHLHMVRFQVLDRRTFDVFAYRNNKGLRYLAAAMPPEPNELGWKDVVQCPPGLITRIIVRFDGYPGKYLYHCHILEHESNDMMRPLEVIA